MRQAGAAVLVTETPIHIFLRVAAAGAGYAAGVLLCGLSAVLVLALFLYLVRPTEAK